MPEQKLTPAQLVEIYYKMKAKLDEGRKAWGDTEKDLKGRMATILEYLQGEMDRQGVLSFKTPFGTPYKTKVDHLKVDNWETALEFIKKEELWHVLTKSLSKDQVKEVIAETKKAFPGVTIDAGYVVRIKKA